MRRCVACDGLCSKTLVVLQPYVHDFTNRILCQVVLPAITTYFIQLRLESPSYQCTPCPMSSHQTLGYLTIH
jgi:hypothetical protein